MEYCSCTGNKSVFFTCLILIFFLVGGGNEICGQVNYSTSYKINDPAPATLGLSPEERYRRHEEFLQKAEAEGDTLLMIHGYNYMFREEVRREDFPAATTYLVQAEYLAERSNKPVYLGAVAFLRGQLHALLKQTDEGIAAYFNARDKCRLAGDSLCVGRSLEQLSAMYLFKRKADTIELFYEQAIVLLEKYGGESDVAIAKTNFARYLNMRFRSDEAIPLLKEVIEIRERGTNGRSITLANNSLAEAYWRTGQYDKAIAQYNKSLQISRNYGLVEGRIGIYAGLEQVYIKLGNYQKAYLYKDSSLAIRDTLIGKRTVQQISEIESKFNTAKKELELATAEKNLVLSNARSERFLWIVCGLGILLFFTVFIWRLQVRIAKKRIEEGSKNLRRLTRQLLEKNTAILVGEKKLSEVEDTEVETDEESPDGELDPLAEPELEHYNILDRTILTEEDWADFKVYFEETHPGFLKKLRTSFNDMTTAEQRLFLLLKLKLTSREIATILGISSGGVKKTRNRLRKRLALATEDSLEEHVDNFGKGSYRQVA